MLGYNAIRCLSEWSYYSSTLEKENFLITSRTFPTKISWNHHFTKFVTCKLLRRGVDFTKYFLVRENFSFFQCFVPLHFYFKLFSWNWFIYITVARSLAENSIWRNSYKLSHCSTIDPIEFRKNLVKSMLPNENCLVSRNFNQGPKCEFIIFAS